MPKPINHVPQTLPKPAPPPSGSSRLPLRNAAFTGRKADLWALAQALLYRPQSRGLAITGPDGIGKSELALEFCQRFGQYFAAVHWLDVSQSIAAQIAMAGAELQLSPWPEKTLEQVDLTLRAWSRSGTRLVVFDGMDDPRQLLAWAELLPSARLLVTSGCEIWPTEADMVVRPLKAFSRGESLLLLRKLAPRLKKLPKADLEPIAASLGDLPLALDLAGRRLHDRKRLAPTGFIEELEAAGGRLEQSALKDWASSHTSPEERSLAAAFCLALDGLDETALNLFLTCGWCAPSQPIPPGLLGASLQLGDRELERYLRSLGACGLLRLAGPDPQLHPLLTAFARLHDIRAERLLPLAQALYDTLNKADESRSAGLEPIFRPHLYAVAGEMEGWDEEKVGKLWSEPGDQQKAAALLNNLAVLFQRMEDLQAARALFERSLDISIAALGPDHLEVADGINNLAILLQEMGEQQLARQFYERALRTRADLLGPDHVDVAVTLSGLAGLFQDMDDLSSARTLYERALSIFESRLPPGHDYIAFVRENLNSLPPQPQQEQPPIIQ